MIQSIESALFSGPGTCLLEQSLRAFERNLLAALGLACLLAGCSSSSVVAQLPGSMGLPSDAPARPVVPYEYPAVHDMPPPRATKPLTEEEQFRLEKELTAIRNRQEGNAPATKNGAKKADKKAASKARKHRAPVQTGGTEAGATTKP
ncbi:MAG TPA: hypothetical protein VHV56_02195 [Pseudolabrys sp.]|nr:hypothetical protein [Pseudolabrys sp.]